jgi:hemerythrin-like domain-containing protein
LTPDSSAIRLAGNDPKPDREVMNRIDNQRDFPADVVMSSAKLIRAFVEDYHEKLEEDYLFPRFRKANKLVELVGVLNQQHQKGRVLTEAREDTILFPAFRKIVSRHEYDALGEEFEKKENQLFHGDGFEKNVEAVAQLEKKLGIYDLAQFTPST